MKDTGEQSNKEVQRAKFLMVLSAESSVSFDLGYITIPRYIALT